VNVSLPQRRRVFCWPSSWDGAAISADILHFPARVLVNSAARGHQRGATLIGAGSAFYSSDLGPSSPGSRLETYGSCGVGVRKRRCPTRSLSRSCQTRPAATTVAETTPQLVGVTCVNWITSSPDFKRRPSGQNRSKCSGFQPDLIAVAQRVFETASCCDSLPPGASDDPGLLGAAQYLDDASAFV
jgi:hypothetical protein